MMKFEILLVIQRLGLRSNYARQKPGDPKGIARFLYDFWVNLISRHDIVETLWENVDQSQK